jgi:hypothetical protein
MSSVTVTLCPKTEQKLNHQASLQGQTLEVYLQKLADREAAADNGVPLAPGKPRNLEELTAPIAEAVQASGVSDEDVGKLFEEVVEERRAERRVKSACGGMQ